MLYYLGKGTQFKKEDCKEYKTKDGALKALAKLADGVVWDENGAVIAYEMNGTVTVADGGQQETSHDGAETAKDGENKAEPEKSTPEDENGENGANSASEDNGQQDEQGNAPQNVSGDGAETAKDGENEAEPEKSTPEDENGENGANNEPEDKEQDSVIIPQGKMKVTVICDGSLNLRRSPSWNNGNVCGRASRGQSYYVKSVRTIEGKKMVETIDGIFLSGASEHVQFEQL